LSIFSQPFLVFACLRHTQILETDRALHFALLRLQLIELIRIYATSPTGDIKPAISFATGQLAPRAATDPDFLKDLELAMSLLIYLPSEAPLPSQFAELLKPSFRRAVASRVNDAILESMAAPRDTRLGDLVRLRVWAEDKARTMGKDLPPKIPFGLQDLDDASSEGMSARDADPMVS
jgi:hypothetical protein